MAAADWSVPILTSLYTDVLDLLKSRDEDTAIMFDETASASAASKPDKTMRFNRTLSRFQEWSSGGAAWADKLLGVAGGGTGAATAADARTALGVGSMGVQSDSAVAIIGGTLTGVSVELAAAGTGLAVQTTNTVDIGTAAKLIRSIYAAANLVLGGLRATNAAAPTIASAAVIAPTKEITFISGVTAINTITAPAPISAAGGQITLIPTGLWSTTLAGNIALATVAVVGKALILTYDVTTTKWYPSY